MKDLFGQEITEADYFSASKAPKTIIEKHTIRTNYRKAERDEGTCRQCEYSFVRQYGKRYWKCTHVGLSSSMSSDINATRTCDLWESAK